MLAQVIDVFHSFGGPQAVMDEIRMRSGQWFDPALVRVFGKVAAQPDFWSGLAAENLASKVCALEPASTAYRWMMSIWTRSPKDLSDHRCQESFHGGS